MTTADLISTLRLLRRFGDSPELERLQEVERHAGNLAREALQQGTIDLPAAEAILRLIGPGK